MMPWHRRPAEGEEFDFMGMLTMLASTSHLLDHAPAGDHHDHDHDHEDHDHAQ
jgi:hypothetical protein